MRKINILLLLLLVAINSMAADDKEGIRSFTEPVNKCTCWVQEDSTVFIDPGSAYYANNSFRYPKDWTLPDKVLDPTTGTVFTVSGVTSNGFTYAYVFNDVEIVHFPETYKTIKDSKALGGGLSDYVKEVYGPGITYVGSCIFGGMNDSKLEKIYLPKVKVLGFGCFRACQLTEADMPELDSVCNNEGSMAFGYCKKLEKVHFPKLRNICDQMFEGCHVLKELDLPNVDTIGYEMELPFNDCRELRRLNLPKVRTIRINTIYGMPKLEEIHMDSLKWITGSSNFNALKHLKRLTLPNLVSCTDKSVLEGCDSLRYLCLPKFEGDLYNAIGTYSLPSLDTLLIPSAKAFSVTTDFNELTMVDIRSVEKPESLSTSAPGFWMAPNIKHIICNNTSILDMICRNASHNYRIPDVYWNNTKYEYAAFDSVEIVNQTEALGDLVFSHMPHIKHIVLHGGSVLENMKAFQMLPDLESIDVADDATGDYSSYDGVLYDRAGNTLLYYPLANETSLDAKGNTRTWQFPERKITGVGPYALYKYAGKETRDHRELHISKGGTCVLGEHALDSSSIDHVTFDLDAPLTTVGDYAMANMTQPAFRYLKMPKALQTVGKAAFSGDTQLQALELYDTQLTTVGDSAFAGETAITSIALPNSVTSIGTQAFYGNTAMEYFTVPRSCTAIGQDAFSATSMKQLNIQVPGTALSSSLATAFTAQPATVLLPANAADGSVPSAWTTVDKQTTDDLETEKYYTLSRSYPIDLSASADIANFYRVITYNVDKTNNAGILYLERLNANDIAAVPANSPVVALLKTGTPAALSYAMAETEPEAWSRNVLEGTPAAVRIDMQASDGEASYYNYLLSHPSTGNTSGVFNIVTSHEWHEASTRKGELTYLHVPYYDTDEPAYARYFTFSTGNATGIDSVARGEDNGKATWYNLQGQRVNNPTHGIFIRNGRKVLR